MGDLSAHFSREEFECSCQECGFNTVDHELIKVLEELREFIQKPIFIVSGCRCYKYNLSIGGVPGSQHTKGRAADIAVKGVAPKIIYLYLQHRYQDRYGIGQYDKFVHIDTRSGPPARW